MIFFSDVPELKYFIRNCRWMLTKSSKIYPLSQHQVSTINFYHKVLDSIISRINDFRERKIVPDFGPILPEPNPYLVGNRNFYSRFNRGRPEQTVPLSYSQRQKTHEVFMILKMAEKERVFDFLSNFLSRLEKTNWRINRQRILDFLDELQRYHAMINYCKLCSNPNYELNKGKEEISALSIKIENNIFNYTKFTSDVKAEVEDLLKKFQIELKSTETLMLDEKRMINEAMSKSFGRQTAGHWYTCPRGHYYCITECGMARQAAKCPECNETIGNGSNYRERRATNLA